MCTFETVKKNRDITSSELSVISNFKFWRNYAALVDYCQTISDDGAYWARYEMKHLYEHGQMLEELIAYYKQCGSPRLVRKFKKELEKWDKVTLPSKPDFLKYKCLINLK